jgi:hypothetical protein
MSNDQKSLALQQLANIVIDAYMHREEQFVPQFSPKARAICYLERPQGEQGHSKLQLDYVYEREDYE